MILAMCLFVSVVTSGEQPEEYVARITRPLRASRALTAFGCRPLSEANEQSVPVDVRSARAACRFTLVGPGQDAEALLIETRSGSLEVYADVNRDGSFSEAERFTLEKGVDPGLSRQLHLQVRATESLSFPVWLGIRSDRGALKLPLAQRLIQSSQVVVEGEVEVGGRPRRIHITAAVTDGRLDPQNARIGFDADGNGTIDESRHSLEVLETMKDRAVFKAGRTYLAVNRVDPIAGEIGLQAVGEADYQLIGITAGSKVPDFVFTDFDGRERRLSEFHGKHVLLDFWGSWCSPCVADIPHLKKAYERFRSRGFKILGLDVEHGATTERVRCLLREKGVTWTNATPESVKSLVFSRFRVTSFPTLVLLDPNQVVVSNLDSELRGKLEITLDKVLPKP